MALIPDSKFPLVLGGISAAIAVVAGAFGAHALKQILSQEMLTVFETAVRYQMYHAFALISIGILGNLSKAETLSFFKSASLLFVVGTLLFSGSLYFLVLTDTKWLGMVTPIGGLCFILGWLAFAYAVWKSQ